MNRYTLIYSILFIMTFIFSSCVKTVENVDVIIEDQYRHYYPIIQGQTIELNWRVGNESDEPLVITDIIPSCGCIEVDKNYNNIIPAGKYINLKFKFDSSKNLGYSSESIFIYGNIKSKNNEGFIELVFDTHVVPVYGNSPDYEEYYMKNKNLEYNIKGIVNGYNNQKGYWINYGDYEEDYNKTYKKYPWLKEESVSK